MTEIDMEWCPNCKKTTAHRHEHERVRSPSVFAKLKSFCRECGQMTREVSFK